MKHGTLVMVRHGESRMNMLNRFTGWFDVPLSEKGIHEAQNVARHCEHYNYDAVFTSGLERAHETLLIILSKQRKLGYFEHSGMIRYNYLVKASKDFIKETVPIYAVDDLNERYYGDLQGLEKNAAVQVYSKDMIRKWRRGYMDVPPNGESLHDVYQRVIPYFEQHIHPRITAGESILIVAHGNTLRSVIKFLEQVDDEQIAFINLPTGLPLVYSCEGDLFNRIEGEYLLNRPLR